MGVFLRNNGFLPHTLFKRGDGRGGDQGRRLSEFWKIPEEFFSKISDFRNSSNFVSDFFKKIKKICD